MKHVRRTFLVLVAAACLVVGGAVGSGLINAGAATSSSTGNSTAGSGRSPGSNEDPAHERGESAAREAAEENGTATFGPGHDGHRGDCHGGPGHDQSQSDSGDPGGASQPSAPSSGAATTSPATWTGAILGRRQSSPR
jgi:hypothetical protein